MSGPNTGDPSSRLTLCVGSVGSGIFTSHDSGHTWRQAPMDMPYPPWSPWVQVRAIVVSPHDPGVFLAGSEVGLHRSRDHGDRWDFLPSPADRHQIWSIAFHPNRPGTIFVGAAPFDGGVSIIRSRDDGATWDVVDVPAPSRSFVGATHITAIAIDPRDDDTIWASCEVGGVYRSRDGGDNWVQVHAMLADWPVSGDVHAVAVMPDGRILATTPDGLWTSVDDGGSFTLHRFQPVDDPEPAGVPFGILAYARGIVQKADDPRTLFVGSGDYTPGRTGSIKISRDGGESWTDAALSHPANSHIYAIATHAADPAVLIAATMFGYLYLSRDGGARWTKLAREFGEVRGLAWSPAPTRGFPARPSGERS